MKTKSRAYLLATVTVAYLISAAPVSADEIIDEIKVTADLRERSLQAVPFSVSVLDAELVDEAAVQHFEELVNVVPNMNWSGDGHRARYFQIRGVGELEQYQGAPNPSVGFLIDDIDFSGIGTIATLFDVESVEVLRGPQGSRYGANALGGLIYVRSAEPSAERDGRLQVTAGDDDYLSIGAAIGGALNAAETTLFRISAQKHESNGFRNNAYLGREDTNGRDEMSLRGGLNFAPNENVSANLSLLYSKIDNGYDAFALDNSFTMLSDKPGKDAQESIGASFRIEWPAFNALTATSISSFADSDIEFSFDADWGNDDSWAPVTYDYVSSSDRSRRTFSQEFRLGTEDWIVGVYALNLTDEILTVNAGDYYDPFYDWADSLDESVFSDFESTNIALFGQYERELRPSIRFSGGLRVERRTTSYSDSGGLSTGPSETLWGGELSISKEFEAVTTYLTLSKGYKAGGFNLGAVPEGKRDFGAEEMWTLEAGSRLLSQSRKLQLNAAIFYNRRQDQQVRTSTQLIPGDPASFVFFTDNVGEGDALGAELDFRWYPADEWELYGAVGLIDASLESGRELAHAPSYTLAAGLVFRDTGGFFARIDVAAKDDFYFDSGHDQKSEPYELLHARVGFEAESWLVALWARNIADTEYAVRGFYFGNEPPDFPDTLYTRGGDPRQMGVTIEKRF